jgi:1-acyl-sn-glycerol-3-phosphate acyltransferase
LTDVHASSSISAVIYVVRYLLVAVYTVLWGTLGVALLPLERSGRAVRWVARSWVRWCLATCGVRVEARGLENVVGNQPCILMSNHQSVFDIAAIVDVLPVSWKFVAKRELLRVPFFGWALALADQIIVDRGDRQKAVKSLQRAAERIRRGVNVIVFPEGTRSADGLLRPPEQFKSGPFHLAIQAGVPIVPVTVSGSHLVTPKRSLRIESGRVLVRFGAPIPTRTLSIDDRAELKKRVREAILAGFEPGLQDNLPAMGGPSSPPPV